MDEQQAVAGALPGPAELFEGLAPLECSFTLRRVDGPPEVCWEAQLRIPGEWMLVCAGRTPQEAMDRLASQAVYSRALCAVPNEHWEAWRQRHRAPPRPY